MRNRARRLSSGSSEAVVRSKPDDVVLDEVAVVVHAVDIRSAAMPHTESQQKRQPITSPPRVGPSEQDSRSLP